MNGVVIECRNLSKRFRIPQSQYSTLKGRIVRPFARTQYTEFQALEDVSFDVHRGDFFGIVGRNGSGKSTLLKMIAGIYQADSGSLRITGDIAPFIELGVGFNDDLSGRDNVFLNGALLGLSRRQLEERYDAIVEFAELEEFMELKLRNFSSGMQVRLAFSIALQAGADILLTDEVLAVGDQRFQRKCFDVFREQKRSGQTVVFVSHDMGAVNQFCDRGLLLDHGTVRSYGPIHEVVRAYHQMNAGEATPAASPTASEIVEAWVEDGDGTTVPAIDTGDSCSIVVTAHAGERLESPFISIGIRDRFGYLVFGTNNALLGHDLGVLEPGDEVEVRFALRPPFAAGRYYVSAGLAWPTSGDVLHRHTDVCLFDVRSPAETTGVVDLEHSVTSRPRARPDLTSGGRST